MYRLTILSKILINSAKPPSETQNLYSHNSAESATVIKSVTAKQSIRDDFGALCLSKTGYPDLNDALNRLHAKQDEFLAVLEYPHLALHNNLVRRQLEVPIRGN